MALIRNCCTIGVLLEVYLPTIPHSIGIYINCSPILEREGNIDYGHGMSIIVDTNGLMEQLDDSHKTGKTKYQVFNYYIIFER